MRLIIPGLTLFGLTLAAACGDDPSDNGQKSGDGDTACETGSLDCACYNNQTCNTGLLCEDSICGDSSGDGDTQGDGDGDGDGDTQGDGDGDGDGDTQGDGDGDGDGDTQGDGDGDGDGLGGDDGMGENSGGNGGTGGDGNGSGASGSGAGDSGGSGGSGGLPGNLVTNGTFAAGFDDWLANPDIGDIQPDSANERACLKTDGYGQFTLAWPLDTDNGFTIKPGVTYQISFRAVSTLGISVSVQIRQSTAPYTWYHNETAVLEETWTQHTYTFNLDSGGSGRGLAFIGSMGSTGTTCFDDVVLREVD